ncbi:MAG TPA: biotin--[acetyl-CoA-carboxylase] ligase [Thermodesulfovibrionales bacterium]|nr:biotin--[acetyl-CoA-carboxylase] ligase [Thermodesulfovibrionales bacterium]
MEQLPALIKGTIGRNLVVLRTVVSTNTFAMELGGTGAPHGTVVIAESQTKGKGRLGRTWASLSGTNIYMSLILRPGITSGNATFLTMAASIACARALREGTALPITIKWPNDLMIGNKKVGGILTEIKSAGERIIFAVIGIGINANADGDAFPPELRDTATSLKIEASREQQKDVLVAGILNEMACWYDALMGDERKVMLDEWRRLSSTLGKTVRVTTGAEVLTGTAEDIDEHGMLLLKVRTGEIRTIHTGDLTILQQNGK